MLEEHEEIPTPAELRERWALEDQPKPITIDWDNWRLEIRRQIRRQNMMGAHGVLAEFLREREARKREKRRRALEMKISEDYWGTKPPRSANRGRDFGFIFRE